MSCSVTPHEFKNKFHSRIDQLFSRAGVEVYVKRHRDIPANINSHNQQKFICSNLEKHLQLDPLLKILKSHRNSDYCAVTIFLNQAKRG
jgi:hypothetical protein